MTEMHAPAARRIAALYDVHGNLPALEAALAAADDAGVDLVVVGGDVVPGPMPRETLERLIALGTRARFLRGNTDRLVVDTFDGRPPAALPPAVREVMAWTAAQLEPRHRDFLAGLPTTLVAMAEGLGEILFCHATPRSDEELLTVRTPDERARSMLAGVDQPIVVCGHTHLQLERVVDDVRLLNAGSVGMPFGGPGAHWLLLGPDVRFVRTAYDAERAADRVRATSYPQAAEFAARHLLSPIPEPEALDLLERLPGSAPSR